MDYLNTLLFGYYPYLAGTVFLLGSIVRFDLAQYTWRAGSSQLLSNGPGFRLGLNLFHIGILLLFFGHFVGLLMPHSWYGAFGLTAQSKQLLAMTAGGLFGTLCFIGLSILLYRRLSNPRVRANSGRMNIFILLLLYLQLILGLLSIPISAGHPDGAVMLQLANWAQHIVLFKAGAAGFITDVHWVYKAHLFLGLTMFLVFPFSRLVHIWSAPVWYLGRRYQIVRRARRAPRRLPRSASVPQTVGHPGGIRVPAPQPVE